MEKATRSDLTATAPDLQAISQDIRLELGKSGLSRYTIGRRLEDAFIHLGTEDQFKQFLAAQLSDCLRLRHARRYREFYRGVQERAKAEGVEPVEFLDQHPEFGVWEKWQKAKKKQEQEEEDSPIIRDPVDEYTSGSKEVEMDHKQVLENIANLFGNTFSYKFKDVTDVMEWDYVFNRLKEELPLKPYHPNRVAA